MKQSRGLEYELLDNGTYSVIGLGICKDRDIIIPKTHNKKSVTSIGDDAFYWCRALTSITIQSSVQNIGSYAFNNCSNLNTVTFAENSQCSSIGKLAFGWCSNLESITIPDSVTSIGDYAFRGCSKLKKLGKWKATGSHMICRKYKFSLGEWHEEPKAILCEKGFHFCENAFDLFNYYYGKIGEDIRFFEVETDEVSEERKDDSKRVCKKIKLVREIKSYAELLNGEK